MSFQSYRGVLFMKLRCAASVLVLTVVMSTSLFAQLWSASGSGSYPGNPGTPGSDAIALASSSIVEWASGVQQYTVGSPAVAGSDTAGSPYITGSNCLGYPAGSGPNNTSVHVTNLGENGSIVLTFPEPIVANGVGDEFAVFSNGLENGYCKLGQVWVSSDDVNWYEEPNFSYTPGTLQTYSAGTVLSNIEGYCGKYEAGYGEPFSIDYPDFPHEVNYVKIVDVQGNGTVLDSAGNPIYGNVPGDDGCNVVGVGVMSAVPEPGTLALVGAIGLAGLFAWRRRRAGVFLNLCLLSIVALAPNPSHGETINFSDLSLPNAGSNTQYAPDGTTVTGYYWDGPDPNGTVQPDGYGYTETVGQFTSGGASFPNTYDNEYGSWSGWAYSNVVDTTTDGYGNQYAAIAGGGIRGGTTTSGGTLTPGAIYAVAYGAPSAYSPAPTITLATPGEVLSADITNTTYAYLSMLNGNDYPAKQFGPDDWFLLTISAFNAAGQPTGTPVDFYLAQNGTIVNNWTNVSLASLGDNVKTLQFDLTSSDNDPLYGMNTPAYFALADLTVAPEPSTLALLAGGMAAVIFTWTKRWRNA